MSKTMKLKEVNDKEVLKKILENNSELRREIENDIIESEMHWVSEKIDCLKGGLADWSIGFYNYNYIEVHDYRELIDGAISATEDYGLVNDEDIKIVKNAKILNDRLYEMDYDNKQYDNLSNKVDRINKEVEEIILKELNNCTSDDILTNEHLLDYFYEFYLDERCSDDMYFDTNTYELFEPISYIKTYA